MQTCELVHPRLLCHVGEGDDAGGNITGSLIHLYECVRTHIPTGIVSHVDGIAPGALRERREGERKRG